MYFGMSYWCYSNKKAYIEKNNSLENLATIFSRKSSTKSAKTKSGVTATV